MEERRRTSRRKTLYRGTISYRNGSIQIDCVVREVSATGAVLDLESVEAIPDRFDLTVSQLGLKLRPVVLRRTKGHSLSVEFVPLPGDQDNAGTIGPQALGERVERLERELVRMNRIIGELRNDLKRYRGEE